MKTLVKEQEARARFNAEAINELRSEYPLDLLLELRKMACSVFYYHLKRLEGQDKYKIQELYQIEQTADIQRYPLECECQKDRSRSFPFLTSWNNGWKQPIRKCFLKAEWNKPSPKPTPFDHA